MEGTIGGESWSLAVCTSLAPMLTLGPVSRKPSRKSDLPTYLLVKQQPAGSTDWTTSATWQWKRPSSAAKSRINDSLIMQQLLSLTGTCVSEDVRQNCQKPLCESVNSRTQIRCKGAANVLVFDCSPSPSLSRPGARELELNKPVSQSLTSTRPSEARES